jgi:hypothetical protein
MAAEPREPLKIPPCGQRAAERQNAGNLLPPAVPADELRSTSIFVPSSSPLSLSPRLLTPMESPFLSAVQNPPPSSPPQDSPKVQDTYELDAGSMVQLRWLKAEPEHTGKKGKLVECSASDGQYSVEMPDGGVLALRPVNLRLLSENEEESQKVASHAAAYVHTRSNPQSRSLSSTSSDSSGELERNERARGAAGTGFAAGAEADGRMQRLCRHLNASVGSALDIRDGQVRGATSMSTASPRSNQHPSSEPKTSSPKTVRSSPVERKGLLINDTAEILLSPPTPLPDLRDECSRLRQRVSDLEAQLQARSCQVSTLVSTLQNLALTREDIALRQMSAVVMKKQYSSVRAAFVIWGRARVRGHLLREKGRKVVLRLRNRTAALALEHWRWKSAHQLKRRLQATKFLRRWVPASDCGRSAEVFKAWHFRTSKQRAVRRVIGRWLSLTLTRCLLTWRSAVEEHIFSRKQDDLLQRAKAAEEKAAELARQLTSANLNLSVLGNYMDHLLQEVRG